MISGLVPNGNGKPLSGVNAPLDGSTAYPDRLAPWLPVYTNLAFAVIVGGGTTGAGGVVEMVLLVPAFEQLMRPLAKQNPAAVRRQRCE